MRTNQSIRRYLVSKIRGLILLTITLFAMPMYVHAQAILVVDDDGQGSLADCDADTPTFDNIQAAVNVATPGDTIFICPGTFDEQVVVTINNLTIHGSGAGTTVLQPTVVAQNTTRLGTSSPVAPILLIDGATGVTVTGLTIDGSTADSGANVFPTCHEIPFITGIFFRNSSGSFDNGHVTNIMSATACTFGIFIQTDQTVSGGVANVTVSNSLVQHYGVSGITCIGQNTVCTLTQNTIKGEGPVNNLAQTGIIIRSEAKGEISGNVITDHALLGAHGVPESAVGIFLFYADPMVNPHLLQNNFFANNQIDVKRTSTAAAWD